MISDIAREQAIYKHSRRSTKSQQLCRHISSKSTRPTRNAPPSRAPSPTHSSSCARLANGSVNGLRAIEADDIAETDEISLRNEQADRDSRWRPPAFPASHKRSFVTRCLAGVADVALPHSTGSVMVLRIHETQGVAQV